MYRVVVRLSKHPAVPPHDFVRSPGRMQFGEGPISARSPTEPLPKSVVSFWNPVSDSSARNVMDGHRSRPLSSPTVIGGAGPSNVPRGRSSVETSRRAAA